MGRRASGIVHWEGRGGSGRTSSCRASRLMGRYMRAAAAASPATASPAAEEDDTDAASPCCCALAACPASASASAADDGDDVAVVDARPPASIRLSARGAA